MLYWGKPIDDWSLLWQPVVVAVFFIGGQTTVILAVTHGDVSLSTPLLGLKILFVAGLLTFFVGASVSPWVWPAGVLAIVSIACLSYQGGDRISGRAPPNSIAWTVLFSLSAALSYAILDCLIQAWGARLLGGNFLADRDRDSKRSVACDVADAGRTLP